MKLREMLRRILEKINNILNKPIENKHLKFGAPFFVFVFMGWLILRQSGTIRYDFRKTRQLSREELEELGFKVDRKPVPLEEMYKKYIEEVDIDNWENVRIPRFWEEEENSQ